MTFDELENLVSLSRENFETLKIAYLANSADHRPDIFLKYLHQHNHLSTEEYESLTKGLEPPIELIPVGGTVAVKKDGPLPGLNITKLLGEGAMGEVHLARDVALKRSVALKLIKSEILDDEVTKARFIREILITAQLDHPNIIPVYSLEKSEDGSLAYTMKVIRGLTLEDLIADCREEVKLGQKPPIPLEERLEIFFKLCDALSYAHARQVIHRDLKPENIMLGPFGEVYVMDWGVAHLMGTAEEKLDEDGTVVGTLTYISPEQVQGEVSTLTPKSDQYVLGLILQELVTLLPAIPKKERIEDIFRSARRGERNPVKHLDPKVKIRPELVAIINKATRHRSNARYENIDDMCEDIRRFLREEPVTARKDPLLATVQRWVYRNRTMAIILFMLVLLIGLATNIVHLYKEQEQQRIAHEREQALGNLLTAIGTQGQKIDQQFLHYRGLLRAIGVSAEAFLQRPPRENKIYFHKDFPTTQKISAMGPADMIDSPRYKMLISVDHPVVKLAPTTTADTVQTRISQLVGLQPYYKQTLLQSLHEDAVTWDEQKVRQQISQKGVPAVWAFVGLEEGIHCAYPGKGGYDDSYDPRQRPWYKKTKGTNGPTCSDPYLDSMGQGLLLPCTMALHDNSKKFIGVAGLEFTLQFITEELLDIPSVKNVKDSILVDKDGHIIVRSSERKPELDKAGKLLLKSYPNQYVLQQIKAQKSGYHLQDNEITVYHRMESLGWYYIIQGNAQQLIGKSL